MKLFKYAIPALIAALSVGFTACGDDEDYGDYAAGKQSPGAFFPVDAPTEYENDLEASTFEVPVQRTSTEAPAEYGLELTDESGLFSCPAQVVFDANSTATKVVISYDPEKVEEALAYEMTLSLKGASDYGQPALDITFVRTAPMVVKPAGPEGLCDYTYNGCYSGTDPGLEVEERYNPNTPNQKTYVVYNWGAGGELHIEMPDATAADADGHIPVLVHLANLGANASSGEPILYADYYSWNLELFGDDQPDLYGGSYYDPEAGQFMLEMAYCYITADNSVKWWGNNYEVLQLYGYPDYSLEIVYSGMFTSAADEYSAICNVVSGPDVAKIKVAASKDLSTAELVEAIQNDTYEGAVELNGSTEAQSVSLAVEDEGDYTVVAVGFDSKGAAQTFAETEFQLSFGAEAKWNPLGTTEMLDGWFGRFYFQDPMNAVIPVDMEQNPEDLNMVRTVGAFAVYRDNECKKAAKTTVVYDLTIPTTCFLVPQKSGFQNSAISTLEGVEPFIANQEGLFLANNEGITREFIAQYMVQQGLPASTVVNGIVELPKPFFSMDGDSYYSWNSTAPTLLMLPDAMESAKAQAKAKAVAAPTFNGLRGDAMFQHIGGKGKQVNRLKIARTTDKRAIRK